MGPDGVPYRAVVSPGGQLEPQLDDAGEFVPIARAAPLAPPGASVTVVNDTGALEVAVRDDKGAPVKAELGPMGKLQPRLDVGGKAQAVVPAPEPAQVVPLIERVEVVAPTVVIGPTNKPMVAVVGSDGVPLEAEVVTTAAGTRELQPKKDSQGETVKALGPTGKAAEPRRIENEAVVVVGAEGVPVLAMNGPDGSIVEAHREADGTLAPRKDARGSAIPVKGPDGQAATALRAAPIVAVDVASATGEARAGGEVRVVATAQLPRAVAMQDGRGELKVALAVKDGKRVEAAVNAKGLLEPVRTSSGAVKPIEDAKEVAPPPAEPEPELVVVMTSEGDAEVGVKLSTGETAVAAKDETGDVKVDAVGRPKVATDAAGKPVMAPAAAAVTDVVLEVPKLTAVIGPDGTPLPAIVGHVRHPPSPRAVPCRSLARLQDGQPIEARVNAEGRIEPVKDEAGQLKVITGVLGAKAKVLDQGNPEIVISAENVPVVVVTNEDGAKMRAELNGDGALVAAMGEDGWPDEVAADAAPATATVKQPEPAAGGGKEESRVPVPAAGEDGELVIVVDDAGNAVPAFVNEEGQRVQAHVTESGALVPFRDESGTAVVIEAKREVSVSKLHTISEEAAAQHRPPSPMIGMKAGAPSPVHSNVELLQRLEQLQGRLVGEDPAQNKEKAKTELRKKKSRAERRRADILRRAAEGDDDALLEAIYAKATDALDGERRKLAKAKELLREARQETRDLSAEFQRERQDMLDDIRRLTQQLKLNETVLKTIQPTVRRSCNYYDIDRVKKQSVWDEDTGTWLVPRLQVEGGEAPSAPAGAESSERLRARMGAVDDGRAKPSSSRARELLGSLEHREAQIRAQLEKDTARFNQGAPRLNPRAAQLLKQAGGGGSPKLPRESGSGPGLLSEQRRRGFTANDWLAKPGR